MVCVRQEGRKDEHNGPFLALEPTRRLLSGGLVEGGAVCWAMARAALPVQLEGDGPVDDGKPKHAHPAQDNAAENARLEVQDKHLGRKERGGVTPGQLGSLFWEAGRASLAASASPARPAPEIRSQFLFYTCGPFGPRWQHFGGL